MQLEFTFRDERALRSELETRSGLRICLTLTDNTRSMLSVKREARGHAVNVRLHHMFLTANPQVISALATWLKTGQAGRAAKDGKAAGLVNEFIRTHAHEIRPQPEKELEAVTRGNIFDLAKIFDELNRQEFQGRVNARIRWGRMPPARRRHSIRFGSFTPCDNIIRIHPLLDQPFVPLFFIRYIVFHEMLHAYLGVEEGPTGRRRYHTPAFSEREEAFKEYKRSLAWQNTRANLSRLLGKRA